MVGKEYMYDQNSVLIATSLFLLMLLSNQIGYRLGNASQSVEDGELKSQTTAIQAGIMGVLALLLGFTFNMSLQRYDMRSQVVIEESGSIAATMLRAKLLPVEYRRDALALLDTYLDLRIEMSHIDLTQQAERVALNKKVNLVQSQLLDLALKASKVDSSAMTTGAFLQAFTTMVQVENKRSAILQLHVPEPVLFLLFIVFITAGGIIGYSSGLGRKRPKLPTVIMSALIVLVVFIIIDLDRPKRGIIKINQDSLLELKPLILAEITSELPLKNK